MTRDTFTKMTRQERIDWAISRIRLGRYLMALLFGMAIGAEVEEHWIIALLLCVELLAVIWSTSMIEDALARFRRR